MLNSIRSCATGIYYLRLSRRISHPALLNIITSKVLVRLLLSKIRRAHRDAPPDLITGESMRLLRKIYDLLGANASKRRAWQWMIPTTIILLTRDDRATHSAGRTEEYNGCLSTTKAGSSICTLGSIFWIDTAVLSSRTQTG